MSNFSRLSKALSRQGIDVEYQAGAYRVRNEHAQASILLPSTLPLEEKAVQQLLSFASVRSHDGHHGVCKACATPDFHPGSVVPVGTVVATDADFVIPGVPGSDINCGMRLVTTGLSHEQLVRKESALVSALQRVILEGARNIPLSSRAFTALFDKGAAEFLEHLPHDGLWAGVDRDRLAREVSNCIGLADFDGHSRYAPEALVGGRETLRDPGLGTVGSGNHFVELQVVDEVLDRHVAYREGLKKGDVVVMIHTGSRDVGFYVGRRWMDRAKAEWPAGLKHPNNGLYGLSGSLAQEYLAAMGVAARYAWLNRVVLAEMVRKELDTLDGTVDSRLVADVPHNVVLRENGMNIHRKGATPAHTGELAIIPGSMGDFSYLATGLGNPDWLSSCSHGAGRSIRRQSQRRLRDVQEDGSWRCVTLSEERRLEEHPSAYKPIGPVISSQEEAGLIKAAVKLRPWLTFKA